MTKMKRGFPEQKREDVNIEPFLSDPLSKLSGSSYEAIMETTKHPTPDYLIGDNAYVEVKQVYDNAEVGTSARWGKVINNIKTEISKQLKSEYVGGKFIVQTPRVMALSGKGKIISVASEIIKGAKSGQDNLILCGINFKIKRYSDKGNLIAFSTTWGGSISPATTIFQNITKKLNTANAQLGYQLDDYKIRRKIVLLVNKYPYASRIEEAIEGLSYCYEDLLERDNIHEIWLQQECGENLPPIHTLVYNRDFLVGFSRSMINGNSVMHQHQFELWYWSLDKKFTDDKTLLLNALQAFLKGNAPHEVFPDPGKRQEMVRLGEWLIERNKISEAIWLIEKFIDDPDPVEPPEKYKGSTEYNYHQQIVEGGAQMIITSVMGHLAWVVMKLAAKSDRHNTKNLELAFNYCKKVFKSHRNLFAIDQWIFALDEVANRRFILAEENIQAYRDFRKLLLDPRGGLVAKYSKYPAIARGLVNVFSYFKDLTTEEAAFVLKELKDTEDIESVLVYFAIYRQHHFKRNDSDKDLITVIRQIDPAIFDYSSEPASSLLEEMINSEDDKHSGIRTGIAWQLWKILSDQPEEFCTLEPWIDKFFSSPFHLEVFSRLEMILRDWYAVEIKGCDNPVHKWLMQFVNLHLAYSERKQVWFSIDHLLPTVAETHPEDLLIIVRKLEKIWMRNGYIGDLTIIFDSYKFLADEKLRKKVRVEYKKIFERMRKENKNVKAREWG